jgi:type II secretory pathway pseudopilin PulG
MQTAPARRASAESGFILIEVLVSALVVLIVAAGVIRLMTATTHAAADQRVKQGAYAVAQEDQARLRSMRLASLNRLVEKTEVPIDGVKYTVESTGKFVSNSTGTDSSCSAEGSGTDYVRIQSSVTWPGSRKPVVMNSIVAPSNGSLDPNHGTLLITITNGQLKGLSGVGISATGAGTFSGTTDENGCANFSDLPAGNYTMTTTATGFVNADAQFSPWSTTVGVVAGSSTPVSFMYDLPGTVIAKFKYRVGSTGTFLPATSDSVVAYNALMTKGAESFGTPGGTRSESVKATPLFPFKEADTIYAGSCESNLPEKAEARAAVIVPANGTVETPQIQLPALNLKVLNGAAAFSGARVTVTDTVCKNSSNQLVKRVYTSNNNGNLSLSGGTSAAEPGLPWGTYNICISGTISSKLRKRTYSNIAVKNLTEGTTLESNLATGEETTTACP